MNIKNNVAAAIIIGLSMSQTAHAGFMGAVEGRSSGLGNQSGIAVELNANSFGEEFQWVGLRASYKVGDSFVVFADVSKLEASAVPLAENFNADYEGQAFGGGFIFQAPMVMAGIQASITGSYHTGKLPDVTSVFLDGVPTETELELKSMSAKFLLSPAEPLLSNGLNVYVALGYSRVETAVAGPKPLEFENLAGFTGGVGLVLPLGFGDAYLGVESIDGDRLAGGGVRFSF